MVPRMDIIKLCGGNMKKIYSILERSVCIFAILLLSVISIILFVNYNSKIIFVIIAYTCVVFIVLALLKLFSFPSHVIISNSRVKVFDFPLLATNKFYVKKRSLILWNSEVDIKDIEKIEVVKLTKEEQINYIGYNHLFKKYLKFNLKYGNPKYVYLGNYSKNQIAKIIYIVKEKSKKK